MNALRVMADRFLITPSVLADLETDLEWQVAPACSRRCWAEARDALAAASWRLPTAGELMTMLSGLPLALLVTPVPGDVFWSASGSPFARDSLVRGVACEGQRRFVVLLLDRGAAARAWGVRSRVRA